MGTEMRRKLVVFVVMLSVLLLLGWAVRYFPSSPVPSAESTSPEQKRILPPPTNETVGSVKEESPATLDFETPVYEKRTIGSQHISTDKAVTENDKPTDLSDYNISIKKEEKKGYQILPGVTVKSGTAQVQLDQDNSRYIEIERNPPNSNNQYQMMLKKKF